MYCEVVRYIEIKCMTTIAQRRGKGKYIIAIFLYYMWNDGIVFEGRQGRLGQHGRNIKAIIKITRVTANKSIKEVKLNHKKRAIAPKGRKRKGNKVQMEQITRWKGRLKHNCINSNIKCNWNPTIYKTA